MLIEAAIKADEEELLIYRWINEGYSVTETFDKYKERFYPKKEESAEETLDKIEKIMNNVAAWAEV